MSRVQIREMVPPKPALIGMIGALLGVLLGLFLGWVFQRALSTQGIADLVIPWTRLAIYVLAGAATGLIAGTIPGAPGRHGQHARRHRSRITPRPAITANTASDGARVAS